MIKRLAIIAVPTFFTVLIMLAAITTGVGAVGPPTDNATFDMPSDNQTSNIIKPLVELVMKGPSVQSSKEKPNAWAAVTNSSGREKKSFSPSDTWFLDIDINLPGWVYIYEYYPQGAASTGRWITYKWELREAGQWRFGPFTPAANEAEGQHIFGIWFYSEDQWAGDGPGLQKGYALYWNYVKSPAPVITPPPTEPVKEAPLIDRIFGFMADRAVVFIPLILLIAILVSLFIYRKRAAREYADIPLLPGGTEDMDTSTAKSDAAVESSPVAVKEAELPQPVNAPRVKLSLPNGAEIRFAGNKSIGRSELSRALEIDQLGLVSRKHFEIIYKDDGYFIEDPGSANGTKLNGSAIGGKGTVALSDGDTIEPASTIKIKFILM